MALKLFGIRVLFGDFLALDSVCLELRRGEIVGLLGHNGSGKSTLLKVAAGLIRPDFGDVVLAGGPDHAMQVGLVPQDYALYDELSALANLRFFGRLYGLRGDRLDRRIALALERACLQDRSTDRVGTFSGGMKQRLSIACALLHEPPILLLDEPTSGLDPISRDHLFRDLQTYRDDGHAILFTTHHPEEAAASCDRTLTLDRGQLMPVAGRESPPRALCLLYGHLRTPLPKYQQRAIQERLAPQAELEITGRRVRLSATHTEALGQALALLLASGADMETFRTTGRPSMPHHTSPEAAP
ncbi:MAG: ABC transporter ATP-binding protein [Gemmataceae bacterium]